MARTKLMFFFDRDEKNTIKTFHKLPEVVVSAYAKSVGLLLENIKDIIDYTILHRGCAKEDINHAIEHVEALMFWAAEHWREFEGVGHFDAALKLMVGVKRAFQEALQLTEWKLD